MTVLARFPRRSLAGQCRRSDHFVRQDLRIVLGSDLLSIGTQADTSDIGKRGRCGELRVAYTFIELLEDLVERLGTDGFREDRIGRN